MKQKKCKNCKGKGYVPVYFTMASRARGIEECPVCKGTGKVESGDKEERKMTKEEARSSVMGAISMALKDPTLQHGFEVICKNLSELEKENAELKANLENIRHYLDNEIPHELINEATTIIYKMV